jgi:outer membrane biosynthesis protein TonB
MRIAVILVSLGLFSASLPPGAQTAPADTQKPEAARGPIDESKADTHECGVEILSDAQGVDFKPWLQSWQRETEKTWKPLFPDEVKPPYLKKGRVVIRFKVLPDGHIMDKSMLLEGRSGEVGLDRAAWIALTRSNYSPLPSEFKGPFLEVRAVFLYNSDGKPSLGSSLQ